MQCRNPWSQSESSSAVITSEACFEKGRAEEAINSGGNPRALPPLQMGPHHSKHRAEECEGDRTKLARYHAAPAMAKVCRPVTGVCLR
jgi:hypothetical protein